MKPIADVLAARLPGQVARSVPSAPLTTYRCGGPLAVRVTVEAEGDVVAVATTPGINEVPVVVIGRGSNLLVADTGFDGVALVLGPGLDHVDIAEDGTNVRAGAATALPVLARRAAAVGASGLEFFVGIPGSVGGAVRMNAGGHGRETRDVLATARLVSLVDGAVREADARELALGYRTSNVDARTVVVAATFLATPDAIEDCEARIAEIVRWRREHQPGGQNAGSVFTNPPDDSAGRLIDACGAKSLRIGGVVVSEKHANFFVAEPGARASDVVELIHEVQRRVEDAFGIHLEPEVQLVGFDGPVR